MRERAVPVGWTGMNFSTLTRSDWRQLTVIIGAVMVVAHVAHRAWALYPSWFFADDYVVLHAATTRPLTLDLVLTDFGSNLMPGARLLAHWVASDEMNWTLAATIVLVMQLVAAVSAFVMLSTLFGTRPAILVPLALYLSSSVTMPAFMWWIAAVNQVPYQAMFFLVVTTAVLYLRTRSTRWLILTLVGLGVALFFYTKALLLGPVLAFLALAYFARGGPRARLTTVIRRYWPAAVSAVLLLGAYAVYYRTTVPQPFKEGEEGKLWEVLQTFIGTSAPTSLLGGPWRWWETTPPVVLASPPFWTVLASWVVLAGLAAYSMLRRRRAAAGWLLLIGYVFALAVLLAQSRGQIYGQLSALEYRYLTDIICVATLCLGLVFLTLRGADAPSVAHEDPPLRIAVPTWATSVLVGAVVAGGLISSTQYVFFWHEDNAGRTYVKNLQADLAQNSDADLPFQELPDNVMPDYTYPVNWTHEFLELFRTPVNFASATDRLQAIDDQGRISDAVVEATTLAEEGPVPDCGWIVRAGSRGRTIPLADAVGDGTWWVRLGYLSSDDTSVTVAAGGQKESTTFETGLNSFFVRLDGPFDSIRVAGVDRGTSVCVDTIEVGIPIPRTALP